MTKRINLPIDEKTAKSLRAGDLVLLSGTVYTARDAAHKRLSECISRGDPLPIELDGAAIYYVGACPPNEGDAVGSCGPTTSSRMDSYTPALLSRGVRALIGKGKRGDEVIRSIRENGAVYFAAIGGAGAYYADCVTECSLIAYPELLSEAINKLTVKNFPAVVAVDSEGNNIYRT